MEKAMGKPTFASNQQSNQSEMGEKRLELLEETNSSKVVPKMTEEVINR